MKPIVTIWRIPGIDRDGDDAEAAMRAALSVHWRRREEWEGMGAHFVDDAPELLEEYDQAADTVVFRFVSEFESEHQS